MLVITRGYPEAVRKKRSPNWIIQVQSPFGKFLDPVADKLLASAVP
jgi:phosphatidylglycerophosphate synthase